MATASDSRWRMPSGRSSARWSRYPASPKRSTSSAIRAFALPRRQVKQARVKIEVLPHRELGIERERLRHVADAMARLQIACVERPAEQQRFALAGRQEPGQHLHRRRLAAAVRADKAEDLAALDGEADPVDRSEIAEPAGEIARRDDRLAVDDAARRYAAIARWPARCSLRQQGDEGLLDRARPGRLLELGRRPGCQRPCRRSSRRASRTARPLPYRRSRPRRSFPAGATACARSVPRTGGATAGRRRSSARRGSAGRDRGSASSTGRASAACRPTASSPGGRQTARARCCRAARRCAHPRSAADWPNRRPKNSMFSRTLRSG